MPHRRREAVTRHTPVHVTLRVREDVGNLRARRAFEAVWAAFQAGHERLGGRLVHYSVQSNHLHLLVEAEDERALARFVGALKIRIARALNRRLARTGKVFVERYHERVLSSPRQVRRALCYVLNNDLRHRRRRETSFDFLSSAPYFDGWREGSVAWPLEIEGSPPCARARAWVLTTGWRRHGAIGLGEVPGPARDMDRHGL